MSNIDPKEQAFEEMNKIETFIDQAAACLTCDPPYPKLEVRQWCEGVSRLYPYVDGEELWWAVLDAAGLGPSTDS